jgi:hypothetical protein
MVAKYPAPRDDAWALFPRICRDSFKIEGVSATYMIGRLDVGGFQSWGRGFLLVSKARRNMSLSEAELRCFGNHSSLQTAPRISPHLHAAHRAWLLQCPTQTARTAPHPRQNTPLDLAATLPMSQDSV